MNSTNVIEEPFGLKIVLRLFYVVVFAVGLCGNLLVCMVVVQQRRMRTVINYFTLNLALSDLIFIIIYLPSQMAAFENNQNWLLGNIGCRIIYSIVPVCLTTSIATLLAISCERFRGIVFPFQPRLRHTTVRKIIISIWLVSLVTAMPLMFVAGTVHKDNNVFCDEEWPSAASSRFYWIAMFLVQYILPLFVMTILYGVAGWKLQKRTTFVSINSTAEIARQRQSQKITKMLVALILLYSFCMLPQHVIYFWTIYGDFWQWKHSLYVFRIANLFPMANSALNSIAYGTLQADFRKAYKKFFKSNGLCFCTKNCRDKSNESKQFQRYRKEAIRKKSSHKEPQQHSFSGHTSSETNGEKNEKPPNKTILERVSSDSRLCLISGESTNTSESKQSETQKNIQENSSSAKELITINKIKEDIAQGNQTSVQTTTYVQVVINTDSRRREKMVPDFIFDTDIEIGDIFLLENAKETIL